jgi:DNA modification methylase
MTVKILIGDVREQLKTLADESVHCVVTSPPYWGLRDYGTAQWDGGLEDCPHEPPQEWIDHNFNANSAFGAGAATQSAAAKGRWYKPDGSCRCGARRIDSQLGLEPTYQEHVEVMVSVFREVKRVLRKDGTLWLNYGDSYNSNQNNHNWLGGKGVGAENYKRPTQSTLKIKDLCGIPWRVAFALQADGWVLRQEIIWSKPNPMPESVKDRCTKAHESIFLFAKAKWTGPEPGRFGHISDEDARWLALCIDTEGCIVVKRVKHEGRGDTFAPQVSFGSTSKPLMDRFMQIVGHGGLATRPGKNAEMFYWQAANNVARDFLHRIYPYLITKQRQARIGVHVDSLTYYRGGKNPERKMRSDAELQQLVSLWARNKELNRFGDPDLSDVPEPAFGRWSDCERYYFDAEAIAEVLATPPHAPGNKLHADKISGPNDRGGSSQWETSMEKVWGSNGTRNKRSVWEIATSPFPEAHFATFPPELPEICIKAGTSEKGCCGKCGKPWARETSVSYTDAGNGNNNMARKGGDFEGTGSARPYDVRKLKSTETLGWSPSCQCLPLSVRGDVARKIIIPCTVLDPFGGAGTTGLVADRLQRNAILIELNPQYADIAKRRIYGDNPLFTEVA